MVESRPKVLLVGPLPPPAFGVAEATRLMLKSKVLADRLQLLHLDTTDAEGFRKMGALGWRNIFLGIKHLSRLTWVLTRERPAVTLLTASAGRYALLRDGMFVALARASHSRVVTYFRGSMYEDVAARAGRLAAYVLRYVARRSALVIVLGQSLRAMVLAICPEATVAVVPNGCPPAVEPQHVGTRDETQPLVLYVGRLSRAKGLDDALRAVRTVADSLETLRFAVCGEWDSPKYQLETMGLVQELGLENTVRFLGPKSGDEKEDLLAQAWVLVVPSHSEGQPWVILEAMSAGLPVVATRTGAVAETIQHGTAGFVAPVGDSKTMADYITRLLRDKTLWERMSNEAVKRHRMHFTMEESHSALVEVLCAVARGQ